MHYNIDKVIKIENKRIKATNLLSSCLVKCEIRLLTIHQP